MKLISVVTHCYNEEDNVEDLYREIKNIFDSRKDYAYEHIFIDNASKDKTVQILKHIASQDKNVKIIVNARNFGQIRSPFYGLLQASGDAVISIACDFQDPPYLVKDFIKKWEEGYKIAIGIKKGSKESFLMFCLRKIYYYIINKLSESELINNFHGYGLYDRKVMEILRSMNDPYPYFRGLICDIGFEKAKIEFVQPIRKKGRSKNNFYTLFEIAMVGVTSYSKIPLRLATITGSLFSFVSFLIAMAYLVYKLIFWKNFSLGMAPLIIGLFFFASVQLLFIGIIGEYIGAIHTQVLHRPLVIEKERINF